MKRQSFSIPEAGAAYAEAEYQPWCEYVRETTRAQVAYKNEIAQAQERHAWAMAQLKLEYEAVERPAHMRLQAATDQALNKYLAQTKDAREAYRDALASETEV